MSITEPSTLLTDYLLGAATLAMAARLAREDRPEGKVSRRLWAGALAATAASAFVGGTYHGFTEHLGTGSRQALWKATVCLIGSMALLMSAGSIRACVTRRFQRWLSAAILAQFAVYTAWMSVHDDFRYVICDYALGMAGVLALHVRARDAASGWMTGGVLLSFTGAALQAGKVGLHAYLNHNDLFHLIQIAANGLFFRGARLLKDAD